MKNRSESSVGREPAEEISKEQKESWNRRLLLWNYLLRTTIPLPSTPSPYLKTTTDEEFLRQVEEEWGEWKKEIVRRKMVFFPLLDPEVGRFILDLSQLPKKERGERLEKENSWIFDEITDQELIEL